MNGFDFRKEQLKDPGLAAIPVIVISATADESNVSALRPEAVISKPVDMEALLKLVRGLCSFPG